MSDLFDDFVFYASGTEAPEIFFRWSALSALSSFVGRRIWAAQGTIVHYPNLNIFLVGPPGVAKSTAMKECKRLVARVSSTIPIAPDSVTLQALMQSLASPDTRQSFQAEGQQQTYQHCTVFANELVTLLGAEPSHMVNFLTDIWDAPTFKNVTKNKGSDDIVGPFVTILGCLTPHTLANPLYRSKLVDGGFSRRVCFCYGGLPARPVAFPEKTPEQLQAFDRCVARGRDILKISGPFKWSPEGREYFTETHTELFNRKAKETDPAVVSYYNSGDGLIIKFAMLLQLASSNERILNVPELTKAKALYEESMVNMQRVFANTGRNELSQYVNDLLNVIREKAPAPVSMRELTRRFLGNLRDAELTECLTQLFRAGHIRPYKIKLPKAELDGYVYVDEADGASQVKPSQAADS